MTSSGTTGHSPQLVLPMIHVLGHFDDVTRDFGSVVNRVNANFGTSFHGFQHTDENVADCLEQMNRYCEAAVPSDEIRQRVLNRPTEEIRRLSEHLRREAEFPALWRYVARARKAYESLIMGERKKLPVVL